jgi:hypothetical protein
VGRAEVAFGGIGVPVAGPWVSAGDVAVSVDGISARVEVGVIVSIGEPGGGSAVWVGKRSVSVTVGVARKVEVGWRVGVGGSHPASQACTRLSTTHRIKLVKPFFLIHNLLIHQLLRPKT